MDFRAGSIPGGDDFGAGDLAAKSTGWLARLFGGAKPVPVNYYNLRNPLRDMALVAIAGPASNFVLATFFYLCQKIMVVELGVWGRDTLGASATHVAVSPESRQVATKGEIAATSSRRLSSVVTSWLPSTA